jgi:hypothetical protein
MHVDQQPYRDLYDAMLEYEGRDSDRWPYDDSFVER